MNYGRIVTAAIVGTIVDGVYGFLVYGILLAGQFAHYPGVFRSMDQQMAFLPYLLCGVFIGMVGVAYIYAKGYEGGSGVAEGARFGATVAIFVIGYVVIVAYATTNVGRRITALLALAALVEWIVNGIAIGLVYKRAR